MYEIIVAQGKHTNQSYNSYIKHYGALNNKYE
jgi:hypothetical protein